MGSRWSIQRMMGFLKAGALPVLLMRALLTDPKAQLAQLQGQAIVGLFVHWATILEFTPQMYAQARSLGQMISRRGASFLRNTMFGYRLALEALALRVRAA